MQVWHPPGPAVLVPPAGRVYKGARVVLQCGVEDWGRGGAAGHRVEWSRDGELVQGVTTGTWTLTGIPDSSNVGKLIKHKGPCVLLVFM